jgi:two-component system alkaline phosphatase synthesis response regulator PhoP
MNMESPQRNFPRRHILVVDDEEDILELLRYNLTREGYETTCVTTGEEALRLARTEHFDLIILDLMLPGMCGLDVCKVLKHESKSASIPVLMLTAKGEEADIVTGLELGADDYVTKPFSPKVLLARVRAVLRRAEQVSEPGDKPIVFPDLVIHPGKREVTVGGKSVELTFSEFQILYILARHPSWVYTRNQIIDAVRGEGYPVTDRSVDFQIFGLRKKLGAAGKFIETVRSVGYRFKGE